MSDLKVPNLNSVTIAGRLTRDPELSYLQGGTPLCKFGIAISRNYKRDDGSKAEDTTFVNVTAWKQAAEYVGQYIKKGRAVLIEGNLKSREWEDKATGQKRSAIEVVAQRVQALDWDGDGKTRAAEPQATRQTRTAPVVEDVETDYDSIPF